MLYMDLEVISVTYSNSKALCYDIFQACPYFGTRQLRETADIVFCPYNYLIDPIIRNSVSTLA